MSNITVITGGTGGMALATARILGESSTLILADLNQERLDQAVADLAKEGIEAVAYACDMTSWDEVRELAQFADAQGDITAVIHTAGLSPAQASAEAILSVNMLGTAYVIEEFYSLMAEGSSMVNIASMAGYNWQPNEQVDQMLDAPLSEGFLENALACVESITSSTPPQIAYVLSKYFTIRYSKQNVARFGAQGIRINTISPGTIHTPMVEAEINQENSAIPGIVAMTPISRLGQASEIATTAAFLVSEQASYVTGSDILCDGGFTSGRALQQVGASVQVSSSVLDD